MSGMAEVLAVHRQGVFADECRGCKLANDGRAYRGFDLAKHQEEMLAAAGFGPVKESAAKALEDAADDFTERVAVTRNMTRDNGTVYATATLNNAYGMEIAATALRARAAAVRGEG